MAPRKVSIIVQICCADHRSATCSWDGIHLVAVAGDNKDDQGKSPAQRDKSKEEERRHKHVSSCSQGNGSVDVAEEAVSPASSLGLLYHSSGESDDHLSHIYDDDAAKQRLDTKNSRRKMERPRKRKRESEGDDLDLNKNGADDVPHENGTSNGTSQSSMPCSPQSSDFQASANKIKSPAPEDLSVKTGHSPHPTRSPMTNGTGLSGLAAATEMYADPATSTSSVRDLEEVMNKHLPALPADSDHLRAGFHPDYSQAMLFQKHKSTIQWIGSQHATTPEGHPATNLLRSIYANRESVIRTNVYNPRPQYYGDMQGSLLTPPGGAADFGSGVNQGKNSSYGLMSGYGSNPISVTMSAANLTEPYSMTPPSSVSPQDKYGSTFPDQCHMDSSQLRYADHHMPIKPQAYPLPAHANGHMAYDRSTAQYASAGYYPTPSPYYNTSSTHYRDATKNATW